MPSNAGPRPGRRRSQSGPPLTSSRSSPCPPIDETLDVVDSYSYEHDNIIPLSVSASSSSPPSPPPPPPPHSQPPSRQPRFLDGILYQRTARNRYMHKRRHVTIDLVDGGTLLCRKDESSLGAAASQQRSVSSNLLRRRNSAAATTTTRSSGASVVLSEREILQTLSLSASSDSIQKRSRTFSGEDVAQSVATYQPDIYGPAEEASTYASLLADTNTDIEDVKLYLPASVPWKMIDVKNDESLFILEVPLPLPQDCIVYSSRRDMTQSKSGGRLRMASSLSNRSRTRSAGSIGGLSDGMEDMSHDDEADLQATSLSLDDSEASAIDGSSYHHVYFKCPGGGNEKSLWLRVGRKLGRLSSSSRTRKSKALVAPVKRRARSRWRKFNQMGVDGSSDARQLDRMLSLRQSEFAETLLLETSSHRELDDKEDADKASAVFEEEFKVYPAYCYLHRWMTNEELTHEMLGPSSYFHDLQEQTENVLIGGSRPGKAIGRLELEILCCTGLPKLDRWSNTDAVCYAVCGPYAFVTDVIPEKNHPIWPRKARRACIFPLHHAFAQVFLGVFDDDGVHQDDDFAGRIELDISRLRPGCTYDVTLPLRLSADVYTRQQGRGTIRLRFKLIWDSEQSAVLSYLPKRGTIATAIKNRKENRVPPPTVTLHCADAKAFRNIAIAVYGTHMPSRYSQKVLRATVREFNLYRKTLQIAIKRRIKDISRWINPIVSLYVLTAWMHCVWANSIILCLPYLLGSLLFLIFRNYLRYNINYKSHWGYAPLTFEELCVSLLSGSATSCCSRRCMEPLEVEIEKSSPELSMYDSRVQGKSSFNIFLSLLGFSAEEFDGKDTVLNDNHLEFPLSDGKKYPKLKAEEAYNRRTKKRTAALKAATSMLDVKEMRKRRGSQVLYESDDEEDNWYERQSQEDLLRELPFAVNAGREALQKNVENVLKAAGEGVRDITDIAQTAGAEVTETIAKVAQRSPKSSNEKKTAPASKVDWSETVETYGTGSAAGQSAMSSDSTKKVPVDERTSCKFISIRTDEEEDGGQESMIPEKERVPEQDASVTDGRKKPLKEDMLELHERMMRNTFHVFDNRVYIARDESGNSSRSATAPDTSTIQGKQESELRRLIGLAPPSNPVSARLADYLGPIVTILRTNNQIARAAFNLFTWKDPYLSFWVGWLLFFLIIFSLVFPYRLFAFVSGLAFVGPQNLLLRIWRERRPSATKENSQLLEKGETLPCRSATLSKLTQRKSRWKRKTPNDKAISTGNGDTSADNMGIQASSVPQYFFSSHTHLVNGTMPQPTSSEADYELVVPYSLFRRNRFYDWPPDKKVSRVVVDTDFADTTTQQQHSNGGWEGVTLGSGYSIPNGADTSSTASGAGSSRQTPRLRQRRRRR